MTSKEKLIQAYSKASKHSNYQVLPKNIKNIIGDNDVQTHTRFEPERLRYLLKVLDIQNRSVLDIGGNTGYFTFEFLDAGAKEIVHYEGNKEHSEFVRFAAEAIGLQHEIQTLNGYFTFDGRYKEYHDIILLFNVLHHVGDDYGDKDLTVEDARRIIMNQLNSLSLNCETMVFQLGFNWQGDVNKPLFEHGTKKEMIEFVRGGVAGDWEIRSIAIAEKAEGSIEYKEMNDKNIERDDSLGEFLNRPIFILKSKKS